MRVTVTGATGLLGPRLVRELTRRGDEVTVLSRSPERARAALEGVQAVAWDPGARPAPAEALEGRDAIVHMAGENIGKRWSDEVKHRIRTSYEQGTRNVVEGIRAARPRPGALICAAASGYYGHRGAEPLGEEAPPGDDFLADVSVAREREAERAAELGVRVVLVRTGLVLDANGGALGRMLPFFKAGVGGPVAGGRQYMPWIHADDVVAIYLAALDDERWSGPVNATAPEPITNREFSKALGRALRRPALLPVPSLALRVLYGEMADVVLEGQNAVPRRALELGYRHRHPRLDEALHSALRSH